jgi:hypothetical protein
MVPLMQKFSCEQRSSAASENRIVWRIERNRMRKKNSWKKRMSPSTRSSPSSA